MKNQYMIIRMSANNLQEGAFLLRGFNRKRIEQVIGVIAVVDGYDNLYHLSHIQIDMLASDTHQNMAGLRWTNLDCHCLEKGISQLPKELADAVNTMRNNRFYHSVDTSIPEVFRECHTEFSYTSPVELRLRMMQTERHEQPIDLSHIPVEDIIAHLRTRIKGVTIIF